jgi:hypothetical protein
MECHCGCGRVLNADQRRRGGRFRTPRCFGLWRKAQPEWAAEQRARLAASAETRHEQALESVWPKVQGLNPAQAYWLGRRDGFTAGCHAKGAR